MAEPWCQHRDRIANERHVHDSCISSFVSVIRIPTAQAQCPCGLYSSVAVGLVALTLRLPPAFEVEGPALGRLGIRLEVAKLLEGKGTEERYGATRTW